MEFRKVFSRPRRTDHQALRAEGDARFAGSRSSHRSRPGGEEVRNLLMQESNPKVKHVALLKFKEGTSQEQIDDIFNQLMDLSENVPGIEDYVAGSNNNPQGVSAGFTHRIVMTCHDSAARDTYLTKADHQALQG